MTDVNEKVLKSLREQAANGGGCIRCGALFVWFNHLGPKPDDCARCHKYGRLFDKGCRNRGCPRERVIDGGWREKGWPS